LNSADLNGTVNPNGFETTAWFEYGTDPSLINPGTTDNQLVGSGFTALSFQKNISGLTSPYTTWYFRVVARNAGGTQWGAIRSFPTGELFVAVGDSITAGEYDDDPSDGIGFEPVLQNLLSTARGYPIAIVNAGVGGVNSAYGAANISTTLSFNPSAKYYLVLYGTNDSDSRFGPPIPSGLGLHPGDVGYNDTYKDNMQRIISAIKASGKLPYLAKVPFNTSTGSSDAAIQEYNAVIIELVAENGISVTPPDFYSYFETHLGELGDGVHPNGTGYRSMANLWNIALP
jgi:lysophospholipase L1-like esterase